MHFFITFHKPFSSEYDSVEFDAKNFDKAFVKLVKGLIEKGIICGFSVTDKDSD